MQRMKVVLPEPDGPMITTTSRRPTVSDTPLRTCSRPNHFSTSVASTTVAVDDRRHAPDRVEDAVVPAHHQAASD